MRRNAVWLGVALLVIAAVTAVVGWSAEGSFALSQVTTETWTAVVPLTVSSDDVLGGVLCTIEYDGTAMTFAGVALAAGLVPPWTIERVNDNQHVVECASDFPLRRVTVLAASDSLFDGLRGTAPLLEFTFTGVACGVHWITLPVACYAPTYTVPNHASTVGLLPLTPAAPYWNLTLTGGAVLRECGTVGVVPETWSRVRGLYR